MSSNGEHNETARKVIVGPDPNKHSGKTQYARGRDPVAAYMYDHSIRLTPQQAGLIEVTNILLSLSFEIVFN